MITNTDIERKEYRDVWVVAEVLSGAIQPVTHELIGAARSLATALGSEVWTVVLGHGVAGQAETLGEWGSDGVILVDDPKLSDFIDETQANILVRLIRARKPEVLICGATTRGRALIPRVAVMANCGLTADCTGLAIDPDTRDLLQTRPAFGGNIMATIRCSNHRPQMSTVRPRVMKSLERIPGRKAKVVRENVNGIRGRFAQEGPRDLPFDRGIGEPRGRPLHRVRGTRRKGSRGLRPPQETRGQGRRAVGASRAAVDSGWIPYAHQVGQTGQTVQSKVYMACGISGQIQHLVGMQSCDYIIAIDRNPDTPMMQLADVAISGDLFEVIPEIIAEIPKT
jgi:electron transfer flavoprotein alpha subunit